METFDLDDTLDSVPAATGPASSRRHWRWLALAVLLTLAVLILVSADQRARTREFDALFGQVQKGQSTIGYADRRVQAMVEYTSPQLHSAEAPARVRAGLRAIVQESAGQQVPSLQARRDAVFRLEVARWHRGQRSARTAYLAYLDYRIGYLRAISANLRTLYEPQPENARLLNAARQALLNIAPGASSSDQVRALLVT
jgi:hypothetical protein